MRRQREHDARRIAAGWRRVPVWLDPETLRHVGRVRAALTCSEQEAIRHAVRDWLG